MDDDIEVMAISKFKATCLSVLERVRQTGQPILITRRGEAVAQVVPPPPAKTGVDWMGSMRTIGRMTDDLIDPAGTAEDWDAVAG